VSAFARVSHERLACMVSSVLDFRLRFLRPGRYIATPLTEEIGW
jgi:hypothetical protein